MPLTKAVPKELLPVFDRPGIQIIAREAAQSGITTLVMVTGRGKSALEDHFDEHPYLESRLQNKPELLATVRGACEGLDVVSVRQGEPLGLGHAVGRGALAASGEPFAVMLPDDLVYGPPALKRLVDLYHQTGKGVVLLFEVPREDTHKYGIVSGVVRPDGVVEITDLVEKPDPADAPTNLAIVGRYVFPASIADHINKTVPGALGEIQLTDAMQALARSEGMLGIMLEGERLDTGNPLGMLLAGIRFAADSSDDARASLKATLETL